MSWIDGQVAVVNLRGVYLTGRAVLPSMVERAGGYAVDTATDRPCRPPELPYVSGSFDIYDASWSSSWKREPPAGPARTCRSSPVVRSCSRLNINEDE